MLEKFPAGEDNEERVKCDNWLKYINNFPVHWKYVSLFAPESP
jgi:hypothetical protein